MSGSVSRVLSILSTTVNFKSMYKTKLPLTIVRQVHQKVLKRYNKKSNLLSHKMPVITAVAVAAHRQNHHLSTVSPNDATHAQLVYRRFRLLSCGSAIDIPGTMPLMRTSSFGGRSSISGPMYPIQDFMRRNYAKGKDKPKTKKAVVTINEDEIREIIDVDSLKKQLEKLMDQMREDFSKQLSVRGAAGALETLVVEFEGESYPLQELAQVGRKNPQLAVLNLASLPDAIQPVIKAIRDSGMNLNPQQEGTTIYVALPKVTREHRENLAKNAKTIFNKYKTNFQAVQNKFIKQVKSQKEASEDLSFRVQQQVMKLAESYIADAEKLLHSKQNELLEINK